ncbi:TIGR04372 family glycosyltransferase [Pseudodesulfovibrio sp.]|uniref:TIGR04372 family glycosyltransferase n=1 Tax=unclassified Pseudodesulfovibrio TaxID=2661612 RepID=UPI003AFF8953
MGKQKQPIYRINLRPYRILTFPLLLPVALLLALFNKLSPIPFKIYPIRVDRVGQMASSNEEYLCELDHGLHPREFRVFVYRDRPSNGALLELLKRAMPIHQIFLPLFDICHKLGGLGVSSMYVHKVSGNDPKGLARFHPGHLSLSEAEKAEGERQCAELGIAPGTPIVPVMSRDNAYLQKIQEPTALDTYRNVEIDSYIPAMEMLANTHAVVRMGTAVTGKLPTSHPGIIDYSLSGKRTELLDVYLSAACRFFLSCGTGLDSITVCSFRKPVLYVHSIPPADVPFFKPNTMVALKKYWHTKEERYLSLSELFSRKLAKMVNASDLSPHDIVVHDCTPEEVTEAVREMTARLDGSWVETDEDKTLQERFRDILEQGTGIRYQGHMSAYSLRTYPFWAE